MALESPTTTDEKYGLIGLRTRFGDGSCFACVAGGSRLNGRVLPGRARKWSFGRDEECPHSNEKQRDAPQESAYVKVTHHDIIVPHRLARPRRLKEMKWTKNSLWFMGAVLALSITIALTAFVYTADNSGASAEYWKWRIQMMGAERAYDKLAVSVADASLIVQHRRAHLFGEALYAIEGMDGALICDDRFYYGCFHQLIGEAVAEHGLSVASKLASVCEKALPDSDACFHSIGHGLVNLLGYEPELLEESVRTCGTLPDPRQFCLSGVFMEYALRTLLQPEGNVRPVENGDRHDVCDNLLNPTIRVSLWCVFWLPTWWSANHLTYPMQGLECRRYEGERFIACIEGIGKMTVFDAKPSPEFTERACRSATTHEQEHVLCVSSAAYQLAFSGHYDMASQMCDLLSNDADVSLCTLYATKKRMVPHVD